MGHPMNDHLFQQVPEQDMGVRGDNETVESVPERGGTGVKHALRPLVASVSGDSGAQASPTSS